MGNAFDYILAKLHLIICTPCIILFHHLISMYTAFVPVDVQLMCHAITKIQNSQSILNSFLFHYYCCFNIPATAAFVSIFFSVQNLSVGKPLLTYIYIYNSSWQTFRMLK
jgi:hypothetical protein